MVRTTVLPNGARVVTEVVDEVYSASIGVWIDVGSHDETLANNGVSHCLEHMLFKGTETRTAQDIAQQIEDVGGSLGAATGKENTCFYGRVLGEHLPVAVDILLDMLLNPRLTDEDIELEKQVILEEIRMYEDDPEDYAHETLLLNVWDGHALSMPITGTCDTVSGIDRKMLSEHIDRFYTPEKLVISIAGKFDENSILEQITRLVGPKIKGTPKDDFTAPNLLKFGAVKYKDVEQAQMSIVCDGLNVTDEKRYQAAILDLCLGGNMSSRLFQEVREKRGLVYSINSFRESHRSCGLLGVYAGCSPKHVQTVLDLVSKELAKFKADGIDQSELNRARVQLKSELLLGLESMRNRSTRNAYGEMYYGRQLSVDEICRDVDLVTAKQVQELAHELIQDKFLSFVVVGPEDQLAPSYSISC